MIWLHLQTCSSDNKICVATGCQEAEAVQRVLPRSVLPTMPGENFVPFHLFLLRLHRQVEFGVAKCGIDGQSLRYIEAPSPKLGSFIVFLMQRTARASISSCLEQHAGAMTLLLKHLLGRALDVQRHVVFDFHWMLCRDFVVCSAQTIWHANCHVKQ